MTNFNKATLAAVFATGDIPQGSDFSNLIYSQVNLVETVLQTMAGPLSTTKLVTPQVSAQNLNIVGTFSAANIKTGTGSFSGVVSADAGIHAAAGTFTGIVSAKNGLFATNGSFSSDVSASTSTVYASAVRSPAGFFGGSGIVSAAGTSQGAAAPLVNFINRGKGVVDSTTTGFAIPANRTGWFQFLYNEGVSANLWPPTGGQINGLPVNTVFPLAASASYTIFHITASAYGVK